jgi:hypothetical protein
MSAQKSDGRPPIVNRSMTVSEHEQNDNDNQQHVRSASNPGTAFFFCSIFYYSHARGVANNRS